MIENHSPARRRRVLIVSPNFPPLNTPDMQRARLALPHLRDCGWEPVILAVEPDHSGTGVLDPLLEETYPANIRVVRVRGISPRLTRRLGIRSIWWRCGRALRRAGDALLSNEPFDLVFFSTTIFDVFSFGPRWLKRFRVPYVLDYQDPWINPYYEMTGTRPPGGWAKFRLTQWFARRHEPAVVRHASAIVSVSDAYASDLAKRYGFPRDRMTVLPFGASSVDFDIAARHRPACPLIDFNDGNFHHVYVGRCGHDMEFTLTALFRAFRLYLDSHPQRATRMRFHFIGTDYAPPPLGRDWVLPLAEAAKVGPFVREHRHRIPYFEALHYMQKADALIAVGSTDATYSASKLFPCVLAQRPLLLIYHDDSSVLRFARDIGVGCPVAFGNVNDVEQLASRVHQFWFCAGAYERIRHPLAARWEPFSAATLSRQLAAVFDRAAAPTVDRT